MTKHSHHEHCEHEEVAYCGHCRVVYCKGCKREWGDCKQSHWPFMDKQVVRSLANDCTPAGPGMPSSRDFARICSHA